MTDNFLGIPVHGDIVSSTDRKDQRPFEELQAELRALLEFESFTALRWRQYTPYFNDGDACVFQIYGVGLRVADLDDGMEVGDYGDGFADIPSTYVSSYSSEETQQLIRSVVGERHRRVYDHVNSVWTVPDSDDGWKHEPNDPDMVIQAEKVAQMIQGGHYYDGLLKAFGDHATVTLAADKIDVTFYQHD